MIRRLLLALCLFSQPALPQAQPASIDSPTEYNDYIVMEQSKLMGKVIEYIVQTIHNDNFREVESKRLEVIGQVELAIQRLEELPPFRGNDTMRREALEVFMLYRDAYVNDYSQINMLKQSREESFRAMSAYLAAQEAAEEKLRQNAQRLSQAQQAFAEAHRIRLTSSPPDSTMMAISAVNHYSRAIFLEFFRVSKANGLCMDALNAQDSQRLLAARERLLEASNLSWEALRAAEPFKGSDNALRAKTLAYVAYHRLLAQKELPELVDILAKQEREDADVDRYNAIIQTYNADIQKLVADFNQAHDDLFRNHIPQAPHADPATKRSPRG
jgi:hypothetical protein